jgi:hypothetical protein
MKPLSTIHALDGTHSTEMKVSLKTSPSTFKLALPTVPLRVPIVLQRLPIGRVEIITPVVLLVQRTSFAVV